MEEIGTRQENDEPSSQQAGDDIDAGISNASIGNPLLEKIKGDRMDGPDGMKRLISVADSSIDEDELREVDPNEHLETLGSGIPAYLAQKYGPKYVVRTHSSTDEEVYTEAAVPDQGLDELFDELEADVTDARAAGTSAAMDGDTTAQGPVGSQHVPNREQQKSSTSATDE